MTTLFIGLIKTCYMFLSRTITFDTSAIGKKIVMDDEKEFTIFRRVRIKGNESPQAYFLVRFKPKKMKPEQNVVFSLLPMMVFMGFTGFRSKYWAVNYSSGLCQGLYEWQTMEDAEKYSKSIAMRFMIGRSDPDSIMYRIIDKKIDQIHFVIQ